MGVNETHTSLKIMLMVMPVSLPPSPPAPLFRSALLRDPEDHGPPSLHRQHPLLLHWRWAGLWELLRRLRPSQPGHAVPLLPEAQQEAKGKAWVFWLGLVIVRCLGFAKLYSYLLLLLLLLIFLLLFSFVFFFLLLFGLLPLLMCESAQTWLCPGRETIVQVRIHSRG